MGIAQKVKKGISSAVMSARKAAAKAAKLSEFELSKLAKNIKKAQKALKQFTTELGEVDHYEIVLKDGTVLHGAGGKVVYISRIPQMMEPEIVIQDQPDLADLVVRNGEADADL